MVASAMRFKRETSIGASPVLKKYEMAMMVYADFLVEKPQQKMEAPIFLVARLFMT